MDDPGRPKPRLPFRPTKPRIQPDFRPREMVPAAEPALRNPLIRMRRTNWSRYSPVTLFFTFIFLLLAPAAFVAIGNEKAALFFVALFLALSALFGALGVLFSLLSPPRFFNSTWLIVLLGNALGPIALAAGLTLYLIKEKESPDSSTSPRASSHQPVPGLLAPARHT
jgi:hypothetical protein